MFKKLFAFSVLFAFAELTNAQNLKAALQYNQNNNWLNEVIVDLDVTSKPKRFFRTETFTTINPNLVFSNQFGSEYADFISSFATNNNFIFIASNGTLWESNGLGTAVDHNHILFKYNYSGQQIASKTNLLGTNYLVKSIVEKNGSIYISGSSRSVARDYKIVKGDSFLNLIKTNGTSGYPNKLLINKNVNELYSIEEGENPWWDDSTIVLRDDNLEPLKSIVVRKAPYINNLGPPYDSDIQAATLANNGNILIIGFENPTSTTQSSIPSNTSIQIKEINLTSSQITTNTINIPNFQNVRSENSSQLVIKNVHIYDIIQLPDNKNVVLGGITTTFYNKDLNNNYEYLKNEFSTLVFKTSSSFVVEWIQLFEDVIGSGINFSQNAAALFLASTSYVNNSSQIPLGSIFILSTDNGSVEGKVRKIGSYGFEYGIKVFETSSQELFLLGDTSSSSIGSSLGGPGDIFIAKFFGYPRKVLVQLSDDLVSWEDSWYTPDISKTGFPWRIEIQK